ncbi:MAG: preprotein translocase subunit SecE [Ardenticatenaceae bacterium]|nr:preprotein translocase subunit SecE [Ardenticatenaceae bacterium]HBY96492.1 preprotein translocase subunit SecE [Chloroflexota bacterium]
MAQAKTGMKDSNAIVVYLRQVRSELGKVVWPTRDQALNLTGVVLAVTVVMSLFLGGLDFIFARLVEALLRVL